MLWGRSDANVRNVELKRAWYPMEYVKSSASSGAVVVAMIVAQFCLWNLLILSFPYSAWGGMVCKIVVWGIPAFLYPRLIEGMAPCEALCLNRVPHSLLIAGSTGFLVLYTGFLHGWKVRPDGLSVFYLIAVVVITPVVEEIAFRGLIFQKLPRVRSVFNNPHTIVSQNALFTGNNVFFIRCLFHPSFALVDSPPQRAL